jgi:hypothetical protein
MKPNKESTSPPLGEVGSLTPLASVTALPRGPRLHTLINVRCELAAVYRDLKLGRISNADAKSRVYALSALANVFQGLDVDRRVAQLEEAAAVKDTTDGD